MTLPVLLLFSFAALDWLARKHQWMAKGAALTLLVFLATGAILTFDRLSRGAGGVYAGVLALKVVCSIVAYQYAFRWRRVGLPVGALDGRMILIFGTATVFLAAVLKGVFDSGVRSPI